MKAYLVLILSFISLISVAQQTTLTNDIPFTPAGNPPPNRVRTYFDKSSNQLRGRLSDGTNVNIVAPAKINGIEADNQGNITLTPALIGIKSDSIRPIQTTTPVFLSMFPKSLKSYSEFSGYDQLFAIYDGSVWTRIAGTTTMSTPGFGAMKTASQNGYYYKRNVESFVNIKWFGARNDIVLTNGVYPLPTNEQLLVDDNADRIQRAMDYVGSAINGTELTTPIGKGIPNSLYCPSGTYFTSKVLKVKSPIRMFGDAGTAFGGTKIQQVTAGFDLFLFTGENQSGNLGAQFEDLKFNCLNSGGQGSIMHIPSTGSIHSIYFYRCWFQGTDKYYIKCEKGDDLKVIDCTFDGSEWYAFSIGDVNSVNNKVVNSVISGCTIYAQKKGIGFINNVDGLIFSNNRVYGADADVVVPFVWDGVSHCIRADKIQIIGNTFYRCNNIYVPKFGNFVLSNNTATKLTAQFVDFGAGAYPISNAVISDNVVTGVWSTTANYGGTVRPLAPIYSSGTGSVGSYLTNNYITQNTFTDSTNVSILGVYAPDSRNSNNRFDNKFYGFATANQMGGSTSQIVDQTIQSKVKVGLTEITKAARTTSFTSVAAKQSFDGTLDLAGGDANSIAERALLPSSTSNIWYLNVNRYENGTGTGGEWRKEVITDIKSGASYETTYDAQTLTMLAWKQYAWVATTQPIITGATSLTANSMITTQGLSGTISGSMATSSPWSTTAYQPIVEAQLLPLDQVYKLTCYIVKSGQEGTYQSYEILISSKGNSNADTPDLVPTIVQTSPSSATTKAIEIRLRKPTTAFAQGAVGIEGRLALSNYVDGTLSWRLIPLYKIDH